MNTKDDEASLMAEEARLAKNGRLPLSQHPKEDLGNYPTGFGKPFGKLNKQERDKLSKWHYQAAAAHPVPAIARMHREQGEAYSTPADLGMDLM